MLTLYKNSRAPANRHDHFIVKWSGFPIGVIRQNDCLQLLFCYSPQSCGLRLAKKAAARRNRQ